MHDDQPEALRSRIYSELFAVIPAQYRHTVLRHEDPEFVLITLGDGTPETKVNAPAFIEWLTKRRLDWDTLRIIFRKKIGLRDPLEFFEEKTNQSLGLSMALKHQTQTPTP